MRRLPSASLWHFGVPEVPAEVLACVAAFSLRTRAILYDVRMGPPGAFMRLSKRDAEERDC